MSNPQVTAIHLTEPITVVGKLFQGDYSKSQQFITEVITELTSASIPFIQGKVLGVYYDNPNEKNPEDLVSFQGVFAADPDIKLPNSLQALQLKGSYLYVKATGDIMTSIHEGYGALFSHISEHNVKLKSPAGYQVTTFENGTMTTEIYMALA